MKLPRLLEKGHDRSAFSCSKIELDCYLRRFAWQTQEKGGARTYVSLEGNQVIAYYTIVVGSVDWADSPPEVRKGLGKYPVPVLVIARLAVDTRFQGRGLAMGLMKDAFRRALQVSDIAGLAAVVVDAKDKDAKAYYERKALGFISLPGNPMRLYLALKMIRANLEAAQ